MSTYLQIAEDVYKEAAENPQEGLCCTTTPIWQLPDLSIPKKMLTMNYGCGSTVHPRDMNKDSRVLYVGVGGGMELLQFSYFCRQTNAVVGIDVVDQMLAACDENLIQAQSENPWFNRNMVDLRKGNALNLPVEDESVDVAAQNCLFNIFEINELKKAIAEMYRVLKPYGRLVLSDPVSEDEIPLNLKKDDRLRALCLSGALKLDDYVKMLTDAGFGTIEIRAKRPYRMLSKETYKLNKHIFIESVEVCAIKDPMPVDGPCVFTGKTAIYFGDQAHFDDGKGHVLMQNQPLAICDKTANAINALGKLDIFISEATYFYDGGGCC